ncbi:hypothetical protein [Deinococcus arenae]|uniref:hypothetical protein n=1 Tax=Deinococcus arenae TaxID=1452751 RepID=UPI001662C19F|nr:hypothetical protein [Deinococcus arenae]
MVDRVWVVRFTRCQPVKKLSIWEGMEITSFDHKGTGTRGEAASTSSQAEWRRIGPPAKVAPKLKAVSGLLFAGKNSGEVQRTGN